MVKRASRKASKSSRKTIRRSTAPKKKSWRIIIPWVVGVAVLVILVASMSAPTGKFTAGADSDSDGLANNMEKYFGSDPTNMDTDGDGCLDGAEAYVYCTDVLIADCDPAVTPAC